MNTYDDDDDQGPILVTVEYRIAPENKKPFLSAMQEVGLERKRDGAYAWNVFEDSAETDRIVETFLIQSFLELRHLRARVTKADRMVEEQRNMFLKGAPNVAFLVAPKRSRGPRRRLSTRRARQSEAESAQVQ